MSEIQQVIEQRFPVYFIANSADVERDPTTELFRLKKRGQIYHAIYNGHECVLLFSIAKTATRFVKENNILNVEILEIGTPYEFVVVFGYDPHEYVIIDLYDLSGETAEPQFGLLRPMVADMRSLLPMRPGHPTSDAPPL